MPEATRVQAMFGRIAPRYDLLNRVLSAGIDQRWRRRILGLAGGVEGRVVVDACCGTGDLALVFARAGARVVGVDFTQPMLRLAGEKPERARSLFVRGDALALPLETDAADFATVAFGVRNLEDRPRGLRELARVVRPGGRVFVLECSLPPNRALASFYRFYFTRMLPRIGGWISGDPDAYRYLPDTVLAWPTPEEFRHEMEAAGLVECGFERLTGGIACLSFGTVPA
jgi:demethylmenaquinone methyltransferase/2-methoxy-6-polyprenyl-1,4-benzoquinol methylase